MTTLKRRPIGFKPALWIAFGFGTGFVPKAPGTAGTLLGIPLVIMISQTSIVLQVVILVVLFVLGCMVCQMAADWLGEQDPGAVVWDEVVGYCVAMAFLPATLTTVVVAFILFRLADIVKPWPISWFERRIAGGTGIMLDDLLAGVLTNIVIHGMIYVGILTP